jgi:hypothetical protein
MAAPKEGSCNRGWNGSPLLNRCIRARIHAHFRLGRVFRWRYDSRTTHGSVSQLLAVIGDVHEQVRVGERFGHLFAGGGHAQPHLRWFIAFIV